MQLINIIVIEDDACERTLMEEFFLNERICNRVDYAEDLGHARSMLSNGVRYHLVLLDIHLPDGSGFDLLPALRNHQPQAQLVCMSPDPPPEMLMIAREAGAGFFIAKPLSLGGLRYIIRRLRNLWLGVLTDDVKSPS